MAGVIEVPLWSPFVDALPVDGGSISVIDGAGLGSTVSTSDELATRLDAMQVELGDGPRWTAFRSGRPVLVPDVAAVGALTRWPLFGVAVGATTAGAVFSFPLVLGLLTVGVADLYSRSAGRDWPAGLVDDASALAAAVALPALRLATESARSERSSAPVGAAELRREVHQATGMLIVQLDVGPADALARLEAYAFVHGRRLVDVARDVVQRRVDFRDHQE